jgi:hypothetical protein
MISPNKEILDTPTGEIRSLLFSRRELHMNHLSFAGFRCPNCARDVLKTKRPIPRPGLQIRGVLLRLFVLGDRAGTPRLPPQADRPGRLGGAN